MDEIVVALLFGYWLLSGGPLPKRARPAVFAYTTYIFLGVLGAAFNGFGGYPKILGTTVGAVLELKWFVAGVGFMVLQRGQRSRGSFNAVFRLTAILAVINCSFVLRDVYFSNGLDIFNEPMNSRAGRYSPHGFMPDKRTSCHLVIIAYAGCLAKVLASRRVLYVLGCLALLPILYLHNVATEMFAVIVTTFVTAFMVAVRLLGYRTGLKTRVFMLALLPLVSIVAFGFLSSQLMAYVDSEYEDRVRTMMYIISYRIDVTFFPFGTGFGTFGSMPSRTLYWSPVYDYFDLSVLWGATPNNPVFLMDVAWPKIFGESGLFGGLALIFTLVLIFRSLAKRAQLEYSNESIFCLFLFMFFAMISTSTSTFGTAIGVYVFGYCTGYALAFTPPPVRILNRESTTKL